MSKKQAELLELTKLLEKCSAMTLLCEKTKNYWVFIKQSYQMPVQLAYQNKLKVSEKIEIFEKLNDQFGTLATSIEHSLSFENTIINGFLKTYDSLIEQCPFESISQKHKDHIITMFEGKCVPEQLLR